MTISLHSYIIVFKISDVMIQVDQLKIPNGYALVTQTRRITKTIVEQKKPSSRRLGFRGFKIRIN